jgi:ABC-type transport system substrate-binding protein
MSLPLALGSIFGHVRLAVRLGLPGCLLVVAACVPATTPAPAAIQDGPTPSTRSGGRVVIGNGADITGLNPLLWADPQSTTVSRRIYESMVGYDPKTGEPQARLAESWSIAPHELSVTYVSATT